MGSKWRKVKLALGLNLCVYVPSNEGSPGRVSDAALLSPAQSSPGFSLSKTMSRSSKKTCSICLATMRPGDGRAIFTAECSHAFHFNCIVSNVKHGNQICPVCRAKWNEIPLQSPSFSPLEWSQTNAMMTVIRRFPPPRRNSTGHVTSPLQVPEPTLFNDDEALDHHPHFIDTSPVNINMEQRKTMEIYAVPEVPAIPGFISHDNFSVLIHLKAPFSVVGKNHISSQASSPQASQAPIDLVTVLDISGSMAGTKLAMLKRAMGFVIQNLGPTDRLSVVAFSSTAHRVFPLRRMSEMGMQQALQAVNSLVASGGTNIAEGLRKGAKVMEDRREKHPVASIILLSDGQDTYTVNGSSTNHQKPNYRSLLPSSINGKIPVHAFGFGSDHDASSLHTVSEISGGTFSFIETEAVIQDAFAQCIGGLMSVVVKDLQVCIESAHSAVSIKNLRSGSYRNSVSDDQRTGFVDVGDLYADEERDFLVSVTVPVDVTSNGTVLLKVRCIYNNPVTNETVLLSSDEVRIKRSELERQEMVSVEVDRQRNRLQAADAMVQARTAAEKGDLSLAVSIIERCRKELSKSVSASSNDKLCIALDAELKEVQERMASRGLYEASGRAYILSGLSSHSWQRATARGDSTEGSSLLHGYQTPLMAEMLSRSQATFLGSPANHRLIQPAWPFASQPKPR